ncbi:MAG: lysostaphin resistance A-like protein [Dehalococcoidia bacterium]
MTLARCKPIVGVLRGGEAALGLGLALLTSGGALGVAILLGVRAPSSLPLFLGITIFQEASLLLIALGVARSRGVSWDTLGLRPPLRGGYMGWAVLAPFAIFGFTLLYTLAVQRLGYTHLLPPPTPAALREAQGLEVLLVVGIVVVLAPLAEEVFFRGFLLTGLSHRFTPSGALVVSSALFAVLHGAVGLMVPVFFAGLVLGLLYLRSGSLLVPWMAHALQNALAYAFGR